jgi:hypothetical protein
MEPLRQLSMQAFVPRPHWPFWAVRFVRQPFPLLLAGSAPFLLPATLGFLHIADKRVNRELLR